MPDYFTLEELRAMPDLDDVEKFVDDRCEAAAAYIVGIIEREVGTSFVPRTVTDEPHDGYTSTIFLRSPYVLSVTSATEDGVAVADSLVVRSGVLRRVDGTSILSWAYGYDNVLVTYQAGYSVTPPPDVKEQALNATRFHLLATTETSSMRARRTSVTTDMSTEQFITAGEGRPTGYPDVDAMILGWKEKLYVPKVA